MIRNMLMKHEDIQSAEHFDFMNLATDVSYLPIAIGSESWTGMCVTPDNLHVYVFKSSGLAGQLTLSAECDVRAYFAGTGPSIEGLDVSSTIGISGTSSIYVGSNGTKLYTLNTTTDLVSQFTLTTAYDITTAVSDSKSFNVSSQETNGKQIQFSTDGTIMIMISPTAKVVNKYTLSTPWDISTASYTQVSAALTQVDTLTNGVFSHDGTILTVYCTYSTVSYQRLYTLSTAWDLSTIVLDSSKYSMTSNGVWFSSDGYHSLSLSGFYVIKLSHSTPFTFDSIEFATIEMESASLKYINYALQAHSFTDDGMNLIVTESTPTSVKNSRIYRLAAKYDINNIASSTYKSNSQAYTALQLSPDGTKVFGTVGSNIVEYQLSTAFDISTISTGPNLVSSNADNFRICNNGNTMLVGNDSTSSLEKYDLSVPWSFSGAETKENSGLLYLISGKDTVPTGVEFAPDGLTMYICGTSSDSVHQYSLSSAYAIHTSVFVASISVISYATAVSGVRLSPDGTKMYVSCTGTDTIFQYSLSTPWLVSSATYSSKSLSLPVGVSAGFYVATDGTSVIYCDSSTDNIVSYTLTTPFDISTGTINDTVSIATHVAESSVGDITFSSDGLYMYLVGATYDTILAFSLSIAWDISTLTYLGRDITSVVFTSIAGLSMSGDGKYFFVIDATRDSVHKLYSPTAYRPDIKLLYGLQPRGDGIGISNALFALEIENIFVSHDGMSVVLHYSPFNLSSAYDATNISAQTLQYFNSNPASQFYLTGKIVHIDTEDRIVITYIATVRSLIKFTY